jgi:hypothetical protein
MHSHVLALSLDGNASTVGIIRGCNGRQKRAEEPGSSGELDVSFVEERFAPYGMAVWRDVLLIADCRALAVTVLALDTSGDPAQWLRSEALHTLAHEPEDADGRPRICDLTVVDDTLFARGLQHSGCITVFTVQPGAPHSGGGAASSSSSSASFASSCPPVRLTASRFVSPPLAVYPDYSYFRHVIRLCGLPPARVLISDWGGGSDQRSPRQFTVSARDCDAKASASASASASAVPDQAQLCPDLCSRWDITARTPVAGAVDRLIVLNGRSDKHNEFAVTGAVSTVTVFDFSEVISTGKGMTAGRSPRVLQSFTLPAEWKDVQCILTIDDLLVGAAADRLLVVPVPVRLTE